MKQIITALANPMVNEELEKCKEIKLLMKDIQYQEGVLEAIEIYPQIDFLIISEILPGQNNIKELIEKIENKKIKVILILREDNYEIKNYYKNKENILVYYNNEIEIEEIKKIIVKKNKEEELKEEIIKLKRIIKEANKKIKRVQNAKIKKPENRKYTKNVLKEEVKKLEQEIEENFIEEHRIIKLAKSTKSKNAKILTILGLGGVGKSVFCVNLAQSLKKSKKKILIVDLDIFNNSIHTLLGVEKIPQKEIQKIENLKINYDKKSVIREIKNFILKIDKNIDLISGVDLIFNSEIEINRNKLVEFIKKEKEYYDAIIIDTSYECNFEHTKCISKISDKLIFLSEANIIQIKKTINLLDMYFKEWNIKKEKINIVFNKNNNESLDIKIAKEIFKNYQIIGEINYIKYYNTLINNNMKNIFIKKNIKNQYTKIQKRLLKNEKIDIYYLNKIRQN